MEKDDTCKLCFDTFEEDNRPRVLYCGHTYCTNCLNKLIKNGNLLCPRCKRDLQATSANDFSVNYDLEENISSAVKPKLVKTTKPQSKTKTTKVESILDEQTNSARDLIFTKNNMISQMKEYDEYLLNKKKKHEEVLKKMSDLTKRHKAIIKAIEEERKTINQKEKEADDHDCSLQGKLSSIDNAKSKREALNKLVDLEESYNGMEKWMDQCQKDFPNTKIVVSHQVLTETIEALSMVSSEENEEIGSSLDLSDDTFTLREKVASLEGEPIRVLTLEKFGHERERWTEMIAADRVYAVSQGEKYAKISEKDGKFFLHHLQERKLPTSSYTIKHSELVSFMDSSTSVAFLDLGWEGSFKGRVLIDLSPNTLLARHFRVLCTGELGASYAQSKFHDAGNLNLSNEYILGGDYECNNGKGGATLFHLDINDAMYKHRADSGVIYINSIPCNAQFVIITGSGWSSLTSNVFGKVIEGLHVLKTAVRHKIIKEVEIIDCGVVLSL